MINKSGKNKVDNAQLLDAITIQTNAVLAALQDSEKKSKKINVSKTITVFIQIVGTVIVLLSWRFQSSDISSKVSELNRVQRVLNEYYNVLNLCYHFSNRGKLALLNGEHIETNFIQDPYVTALADEAVNLCLIDSIIYSSLPIGEVILGEEITEQWKAQKIADLKKEVSSIMASYDTIGVTELIFWVITKEKGAQNSGHHVAFLTQYSQRLEGELSNSNEKFKTWYMIGAFLVLIGVFKDIPSIIKWKTSTKHRN